jgi:ketosteroid isomerase-like protein
VSEENVAMVMAVQAAPDADMAKMFRDDAIWAELKVAVGHLFHADCETTLPLLGSAKTYVGIDGIRDAWLDWLVPWATYRTEIEKAIDLGDRVLLLVHDYGRREESTEEVGGEVAAIWTIRDAKIARADFYADRTEALKAVGLAP